MYNCCFFLQMYVCYPFLALGMKWVNNRMFAKRCSPLTSCLVTEFSLSYLKLYLNFKIRLQN